MGETNSESELISDHQGTWTVRVTMIGGGGVSGEYDLCEMDEDAMNNNEGMDNISESSATTTATVATVEALSSSQVDTLESDISGSGGDISGGGGTGMMMPTAAALKSTMMKQQNGSNKIMSIVHSYNYTGKYNWR